MNLILRKLIKGIVIDDKDIEEELYDMCDREHASCNDSCLIYNKCCPEIIKNKLEWDCPFFKSPKKMLEKLRDIKEEI